VGHVRDAGKLLGFACLVDEGGQIPVFFSVERGFIIDVSVSNKHASMIIADHSYVKDA
jgi:hypothetical protein